jgi:hypothetical protein
MAFQLEAVGAVLVTDQAERLHGDVVWLIWPCM